MGTLTSSGYLVSAVTVTWASGQTLDSLTDNEWTDLSDAEDNSSTKYLFADFEIYLASAAFGLAGSAIELFLVSSVDGTNYGTWIGNATGDTLSNYNFWQGGGFTTRTTVAQRIVVPEVSLPPGLFKVGLRSKTNVTLAATGNTVKYRPHSNSW